MDDKAVKHEKNPGFTVWEDKWTASGIRGDSVIEPDSDGDMNGAFYGAFYSDESENDPDNSEVWETEDSEDEDELDVWITATSYIGLFIMLTI